VQNQTLGLACVLTACILSGLGGIYFEKILKGSTVSVWMRGIQLSLLSIPLGLFVAYLKHFKGIQENGFFFGYDSFVIYLIFLNAMGGVLVGVVVKYADMILKGFASSIAIVISCMASVFLFGFIVSTQFIIGAFVVIASIFLYGYKPKQSNLQQLPSAKV
jgi:UDP-sugar transporter A1/2/3